MRGIREWRWHLNEMYVKVNGEMRYLWRAVDHEGEILGRTTYLRLRSAALAEWQEFMGETCATKARALPIRELCELV